MQDSSDHKPSYALAVSDGFVTTAPSEGDVTYSVNVKNSIPPTETTAFRAGISIVITAGSTLVGFAAWRYRNHQDAKRRRQQSIIANIIRDDLNLSGVHDFTSERGAQLLEAISGISRKLEKKEIDVILMMRAEQENFAHKLAQCLKAYISPIPPADVVAGDNIITQTGRYYYYHKVKPLIKSQAVWLDTDAVKKAADAIAEQVKLKLNTEDEEVMENTNNDTKSTLMQPLL